MTIQTLLILFCGALFGVLMTFVAIGFCIAASEDNCPNCKKKSTRK